MSTAAKHHPYALRIPDAEAKDLAKAQAVSGQSINQLVVLCVRKALPEIVSYFNTATRVSNVSPLSPAEWRSIYAGKDELEGVSAKQLAQFQSQREPQ